MTFDFKKYSTRKILLALSGGADSMALFYLLKESGLPFEVAHVDHGWRKGSDLEAINLKKWVQNTPFHLLTLKKDDLTGNMEASARDIRLQFLKATAIKIGADAIFMAHHADDLAETVLKKVLEGVLPYKLTGIEEQQWVDGLRIIRPLLNLKKQDLLNYLANRPYIEDKTNLSDMNLRGRMRTQIFPFLKDQFKKNPVPALLKLSSDASELNAFLERKIPFEPVRGPFGQYIDLSLISDPFELKFLIAKFLSLVQHPVNQGEIEEISHWIKDKKGNLERGDLKIDRGILFHAQSLMPWKETFPLEVGHARLSDWSIEVKREASHFKGDWRSFWRGDFQMTVFGKGLRLSQPDKSLNALWQKSKTPAFLRGVLPAVYEESQMVADFLSGRIMKNEGDPLTISLKFHQKS